MQIEKWCEDQYPSFVHMVESGRQTFSPNDPRSAVATADDERQRKAWLDKKRQELLSTTADVVKAVQNTEQGMDSGEIIKYVVMILGAVTLLTFGTAYALIFWLDYGRALN